MQPWIEDYFLFSDDPKRIVDFYRKRLQVLEREQVMRSTYEVTIASNRTGRINADIFSLHSHF